MDSEQEFGKSEDEYLKLMLKYMLEKTATQNIIESFAHTTEEIVKFSIWMAASGGVVLGYIFSQTDWLVTYVEKDKMNLIVSFFLLSVFLGFILKLVKFKLDTVSSLINVVKKRQKETREKYDRIVDDAKNRGVTISNLDKDEIMPSIDSAYKEYIESLPFLLKMFVSKKAPTFKNNIKTFTWCSFIIRTLLMLQVTIFMISCGILTFEFIY